MRRRADEEHFPSTIDPRIYHVKLIREHSAISPANACSTSAAAKAASRASFTSSSPRPNRGASTSREEMLRFVPEGIHTRAGSMTELPFEDGWFDGAYATESLEHAVEIEKAVGEICRVVKPGGRIAIIDKNAEHWGQPGNSGMGEMVHPQRTGATAAPPLPPGVEPVHLLLGRRRARRPVSGLAGGEIATDTMDGVDLYHAIGGAETCRRLSVSFYARVSAGSVLRPSFPGRVRSAQSKSSRRSSLSSWAAPRRRSTALVAEPP